MRGMEQLPRILGYAVTPMTAVVCLLALWKGAGAERHGALTLIISIPVQLAIIWALKALGTDRLTVAVYTDIVLSFGIGLSFMAAAMRFQSPWLGVAFMLQGIELGISSWVLGADFLAHRRVYFMSLNVISLATLMVLLCATVGTILVRRKRALTQFEQRGASASFADLGGAIADIVWCMIPRRAKRAQVNRSGRPKSA